MVKSSATSRVPLASTARSVDDHKTDSSDDSSPMQTVFRGAAIGMSWQLAVVVLLPILLGYWLDQKTGSSPWWTLTGMILALSGTIIVIRRALSTMNNFNVDKAEPKK